MTAFDDWIETLRADDPAFAEGSARYPINRWEWQAPIYLLSGEGALWGRFGPMTIRDGHFGLIGTEARALSGFDDEGNPDPQAPTIIDRQEYTNSDVELLAWVQYMWTDSWIEGTRPIPYGLDETRFERWHTAVRIRRGQAPPVPGAPPTR